MFPEGCPNSFGGCPGNKKGCRGIRALFFLCSRFFFSISWGSERKTQNFLVRFRLGEGRRRLELLWPGRLNLVFLEGGIYGYRSGFWGF